MIKFCRVLIVMLLSLAFVAIPTVISLFNFIWKFFWDRFSKFIKKNVPTRLGTISANFCVFWNFFSSNLPFRFLCFFYDFLFEVKFWPLLILPILVEYFLFKLIAINLIWAFYSSKDWIWKGANFVVLLHWTILAKHLFTIKALNHVLYLDSILTQTACVIKLWRLNSVISFILIRIARLVCKLIDIIIKYSISSMLLFLSVQRFRKSKILTKFSQFSNRHACVRDAICLIELFELIFWSSVLRVVLNMIF